MAIFSTGSAAPNEAESTMKLLLAATQAGNYHEFLAPGTEGFQKGISKAMFDSVSKQVASRLQAGYKADYLAELRQGEFRVFLWKISFSDGGYEFVARLALAAGGKIVGFLLN